MEATKQGAWLLKAILRGLRRTQTVSSEMAAVAQKASSKTSYFVYAACQADKPGDRLESASYRTCAEREGRRGTGRNEPRTKAPPLTGEHSTLGLRTTPGKHCVGGCDLRAPSLDDTVQLFQTQKDSSTERAGQEELSAAELWKTWRCGQVAHNGASVQCERASPTTRLAVEQTHFKNSVNA